MRGDPAVLSGLLFLVLAAAAPAPVAGAPAVTEPPFGADLSSPHQAGAKVDTLPARGVLALLGGGAHPTATLRELKASPTLARVLALEGLAPDDFFGRLVANAAGTPDPLLSNWASGAGLWGSVLDSMDAEGLPAFAVESRRVLSLLPPEPRLSLRFTLVPFFSVSGFSEVATSAEGDDVTFVVDLPRIAGESLATASPRETTLRALRATGSAAWRTLFATRFSAGPAWKENAPDHDALFVKTVLEGPPTLFLIPDEFYPLEVVFEEPISRALSRWSGIVEVLADPKRKEAERAEVLGRSLAGDFWNRPAAVVGAVMTDAILRRAGREAYLKALASGPRAVVALWLEVTRGTKLPQPTKGARKELEKRLSASAGAAKG